MVEALLPTKLWRAIYAYDPTWHDAFRVVQAHVRLNARVIPMRGRRPRVPGRLYMVKRATPSPGSRGRVLSGQEPCALHCVVTEPIDASAGRRYMDRVSRRRAATKKKHLAG